MTVMQTIAMVWTMILTVGLMAFSGFHLKTLVGIERRSEEAIGRMVGHAMIIVSGLFLLFFYALWPMVFLVGVGVYYLVSGFNRRPPGCYVEIMVGFSTIISWIFWIKFG